MFLSTLGMLAFGVAGFVLSMKVFHAIVGGEMTLFAWEFKREGHERVFQIWMTVWAAVSLALFFAALKCYLGPLYY